MGRAMEPPAGAIQRAVLVAVPLALVVLIVVTPSLIGREQPATAIPILHIELLGDAPNETALLYVRSALGITIYRYLAINVTGLGAYQGANWSRVDAEAPSVWVKVPVPEARLVNVTAVAVEERGRFAYNATVEFVEDPDGTILRVLPEDATTPRESRRLFTVSMRREAMP